MKKILACVFSGLLTFSSLFAGVFNTRFIEVKTNIPFDFGNTVFSLDDFLKEDVVINFKELADKVPNSGFQLKSALSPSLEVNVNIANLHCGVFLNMDLYGTMTVSKDIFNFIGYGYDYEKDGKVNFAADFYTEAYTAIGASIGMRKRKTSFNISPSVYLPLFYATTKDSKFEFENNKNGEFNGNLSGLMTVYSQFGLSENTDDFLGLNPSILNDANEGIAYLDPDNVSETIAWMFKNAGFDIAASMEAPVFLGFTGEFSFRCPVVPGKFNTKSEISYNYPVSIKADDFINSDSEEKEMPEFKCQYETKSEKKSICRPLKLNAALKFAPFGNWLYVKGGIGMGVRAPFSSDATFFPEYIVEGSAVLLSGLVGAKLSTEYTNQIFIHKAMVSIGMRIVQLDVGLSAESPVLTKSFAFSGLGFNVGLSVGF